MRLARARGRWGAALAALALLLTSVGAIALSASPAGASNAPITGGGSGFAALEINQWQADTARRPYNLSVNYSAQGSSFGRGQFASGQLDFGASDIVYVPNDGDAGLPAMQRNRCKGLSLPACFRYVPVSAGGLSFMYNLTDNAGNRVTNLQLTRQQVCKIFTYQITDWGQIIPGFSGRPITTFARSDGAGESYVLSQFCLAVDPGDWQNFINAVGSNPDLAAPDLLAHQPISNWPQVVAPGHNFVSGADALANAVASGDTGRDSIGYDAAGYAKVRGVPVASVQNAAGVFTQPDETNVTIALEYATPNLDPTQLGTFHLNFDGPDPRSYFPSTYSYVLAQTGGWDANKGSTLAQFLCYAVGQGQVIAPNLRYARLSSPIVAISVDAINQIPSTAGRCVPSGPPPPPPIPTINGGPGGGSSTTNGNANGAGNGAGANGANGANGGANAGAGGAGAGANGINGSGSNDTSANGEGGAGGSSDNGRGVGANGECLRTTPASTSTSTSSTSTSSTSTSTSSPSTSSRSSSSPSSSSPSGSSTSTSTSSTSVLRSAPTSTGAPAASPPRTSTSTTRKPIPAAPCRELLRTLGSRGSHGIDNGQVILIVLIGVAAGFGGAVLNRARRRTS